MKVYIVSDLEGVGGTVFYCSGRKNTYLSAEISADERILLTGEINAAVRGACAAGATTVIVHDAHGKGYTICPQDLDERAELIHGRNSHRVDMGTLHPDLDETVDALLLVGMHPRAATIGGITPYSLIRVTKPTGETYDLGEGDFSASWAGAFGVPTVFVSGDAAACRQVREWIPDIETVATKQSYASQFTRTRAPKACRRLIEQGVERALARRESIQSFVIGGPCSVRIADRNPERLWPAEAKTCETYREAVVHAMRNVPWRKPIAEVDDGWRYPDAMQPGSVTSEWN